jgi:hypothetical protein
MTPGALSWEDGVHLLLFLLASILFAVAIKGYRGTRTTRVLLFASAFGLFFVKEAIVVGEIILGDRSLFAAAELAAEAAVLVAFFLAMVKG